MNHNAFLLLGSNQQSPLLQLQIAKEYLAQCPLKIKKISSQLETIPYGFPNQANFWNQILWIETNLDPFQLLYVTLSIEKRMGRVRKEKWGPRTIDLDWLFIDQLILQDKELILPHYDAENRWFVIHLMMELNPEMNFPTLNKTIQTIYENKKYYLSYCYNQEKKYNSTNLVFL